MIYREKPSDIVDKQLNPHAQRRMKMIRQRHIDNGVIETYPGSIIPSMPEDTTRHSVEQPWTGRRTKPNNGDAE